jgi:hypothetical protein
MNDLDPSILKYFYKDYYQDAKELTKVGLYRPTIFPIKERECFSVPLVKVDLWE